ncbi:MAG TPA: AAA family ATPase [Candidatus Levybacteria bacterium]|nr:AAA family ATPase [Candidatus Levybacteria bacterium]
MNPTAPGDTSNVPEKASGSNPAQQVPVDLKDSGKVLAGKQTDRLEEKLKNAQLPEELQEKATAMIARLKIIANEGSFFTEYDSIGRYIDWITALPWSKSSEDILDLAHARQVLDKNHYGLTDVKEKLLEYLSILTIKKVRNLSDDAVARAPIISLVGLVGVGKTTIAYSIAEALGRKIERIPFGGMGSATQLRGQSRFNPDAEPGLVIKALRRAGTNNPVLLLDEIDRVSENARADIMGVLVELLDPEQNRAFVDHYIDQPVNLSNVLFVATSNNTKDISTAVLDRLEVIQMPSYTDTEKIYIAKSYLFPRVLAESGLTPQDIVMSDDVWEDIVRPLGYDSGIRSLRRTVQGLVRKVVLMALEGKIPQGKTFTVTRENIKQLVPQW